MTKVRVLVGVLAVLLLAGFAAGCRQVSDQSKQEAKKKVEAKAKQDEKEVKKKAEGKGQQAKQEVKKKVEAGKKDLQKKVDDVKQEVEAGQNHTAIDQLDQKIQIQPPPEYFEQRGDFIHNPEYACEPRVDACPYVGTKATGAKELASITEEITHNYVRRYDVFSVRFYDGGDDPWLTDATSYCFEDKEAAVSALRGALDEAELLGKTYNCYVSIYEGYGPLKQR